MNRLKTNFAVISQCTHSSIKNILQGLQVLEDLQVTFDVILGKVLIIKKCFDGINKIILQI